MGMTMTQKILAAHAGLDSVKAGQLIEANLDLVLGNDVTTPVAVTEFKKIGFENVFDKEKIAILRLLNNVNISELLLMKRALRTISRSDRWVLSTPLYPKKDLL